MRAQNPAHDLVATAAVTWIVVWVIGFVAIGVNHVLAREPDSLWLFASWAWAALFWLSIICAGGVAEVRYAFRSHAR